MELHVSADYFRLAYEAAERATQLARAHQTHTLTTGGPGRSPRAPGSGTGNQGHMKTTLIMALHAETVDMVLCREGFKMYNYVLFISLNLYL